MDKNHIVRKDLIEAWERFTNKSCTLEDYTIIFDSIMDDDGLQSFDEVAGRIWDNAMNNLPPTPEERKEIYRKQAAQFLAEYENRQATQSMPVPSRTKKVRFRKIFYAAAAILILGLLTPAVYLYMKSNIEQTVQYIEKVTPRGEIMTFLLPDLTEVTLNAGSRIVFPAIYSGSERSVELYGEALFDVTSNPDRPFIVKTENMKITVKGTVFNVKDYNDDVISSVSVASGKVEVDLAKDIIMLDPNQQLKMEKNTGNFKRINVDANKLMLWTNGTLYFHRTPIHEVVNILNRHYPQIYIVLDEGEYSNLISGEYENIYPVEEILKSILYITGLKCKKTGNVYTLIN